MALQSDALRLRYATRLIDSKAQSQSFCGNSTRAILFVELLMSHARLSLHSPVIYCRGLEIQSVAKYLTKCSITKDFQQPSSCTGGGVFKAYCKLSAECERRSPSLFFGYLFFSRYGKGYQVC